MTLEIIGAGFGRTGTLSVQTALNDLGIPCYHMVEVMGNKQNRTHLDFWRRVADHPPGTQFDWDHVFGAYRATVDNPGCCVWRELIAAHPDAKVLLTLHPRGAEGWYDSTITTIYAYERKWQYRALALFTPTLRKFSEMSEKLIWQRSHAGKLDDRAQAIAHYHRHVEEVKAAVPPERLLVFSVDQGWAPLCDFLGVPAPDRPFPNVNDRKSMQRKFYLVVAALTLGLLGFFGLTAALVYAVIRLFA